MISGTVNANREAVIHLQVRGANGQEQQIEAVIDTGFTGSLTLPPDLIAALAMPLIHQRRAILGDGSEVIFDVHEATVIWDGQPRNIAAHAAGVDALVGMSMLYGYDLRIQAIDGGSVTISALP